MKKFKDFANLLEGYDDYDEEERSGWDEEQDALEANIHDAVAGYVESFIDFDDEGIPVNAEEGLKKAIDCFAHDKEPNDEAISVMDSFRGVTGIERISDKDLFELFAEEICRYVGFKD